jgi:hypothetical protein
VLETIGVIIKRAKERRRDICLKEEIDVAKSDVLKMSKELSKFN